jgi:hypothetical protein
MANESNWIATQSAKQMNEAKEALRAVKKAQGAQKMVKVGTYYICVPESLTAGEVTERIKKHQELVKHFEK